MTESPFPNAFPHGDIEEIFPDVFNVTGTVSMPGALPMSFSRNMTIIRENGNLTLVNSVRLNEKGLKSLEALGKVTNVIRLAGFHGMDDPFYKDKYGAKIFAMEGHKYFKGFNAPKDDDQGYFQPDAFLNASSPLPISNAELYFFSSASPSEGLLLLKKDGGILISGDCLQNWAKTDRFFSFPAKIMMKLMGFIKPHNIGPGWLKFAKPNHDELKGLLSLEFKHVVPTHGTVVKDIGKTAYSESILKVIGN